MSGTVTLEPDHFPPRVRIDTTAESVTRTVVGTSDAIAVRGTVEAGVIYDYECPQETPVTYLDGDGLAVTVELPNVGDWLIHLADPELSQPVVIREHPGWQSPVVQAVADIPGGPTIVRTFGRQADRGEFAVNTYSHDETAALQALLEDGSILFLSSHAELGFGPAYLSVGSIDWARLVNYSGNPRRVLALPYVEVARPAWVQSTGGRIMDLVGPIASQAGTIADLGR